MLDDSLPTFRFQPSSDNPLHTLLYFTHNGSEPTAEYLLKRPSVGQSKNQYALGLVDVHYASVIYGEVLIQPQWTQPSLSAAELRAQGGVSTVVPMTPDVLPVSLYNPDQTIPLKLQRSSFKSDSWEFEIPEQTFKPPSTSQIDQESSSAGITELTPKVLFRWKRDSRLSKDMTCYMTGRSFGGKKSKEPDITVAMYHASKHESTVVIYEPNMARVEVEDRKGLEVVLLLSAEVIRDLYLMPKNNPFNTSGAPVPVGSAQTQAIPTSPPRPSLGGGGRPPAQTAYASGALGGGPPLNSAPRPGISSPPGRDSKQQAAIDAETKRLQAMVAEEEQKSRDRERRDQEEQRRIQAMLEREEEDRQRRKQAEIEEETERLRRQYGLPADTPSLPPRPGTQGGSQWFGGASGQAMPPRPSSTGPSGSSYTLPPQQAQQQHGRAYKFGNALGSFLHGKDDKEQKVNKKRSVHF
ncbi:hypothetical protein CCM_08064 [Cordyceps militaris CM01]|uniref:Uncharacterized protein n=1 Tax=Cordyceps militaris (strain CM01) TaxID=983644 RepID=G3JNH1_CORMM|nr:uncharacterized protein CCM_08064 [Cordyceps militaris CM01]EGX89811.1 hypothetical protein CCM_08064 [Cordyceps militaris CM01]